MQIAFFVCTKEKRNRNEEGKEKMARHNIAFLYAQVYKKPEFKLNRETGEPEYGMMYLTVLRGYRDVKDGKLYTKQDHPMVMTKEPTILQQMVELNENDIVLVKGTIASKNIRKGSFCPDETCLDENGNRTKNIVDGLLMYINPIYMQKICSFESKGAAIEYLNQHKEISNQVYVLGTLVRDPKKFKTKNGLIITQYQIALNRKYKTRTDPPEVRTDYPWVKSYGEQAVEDRMRLHTGSGVFIDGIIQARRVHRKTKCRCCGKEYEWIDNTMELVPYDIEYMPGTFYSDEDIETTKQEKAADVFKKLFGGDEKDDILDEDMNVVE